MKAPYMLRMTQRVPGSYGKGIAVLLQAWHGQEVYRKKDKGKPVPLQAWPGTEGTRKLR